MENSLCLENNCIMNCMAKLLVNLLNIWNILQMKIRFFIFGQKVDEILGSF